MNKKYVLTDETKIVNGHILHKIQSLIDFNDVKKGDLGGYIESEENLSHDDECWVYHKACVYENARIFNYAQVYGNAKVYGNVKVHENAKVYDNARVYENAEIFGNSKVHGNAEVYGYVKVFGNTDVLRDAKVFGDAKVYDAQCIQYGTVTTDILKEKDWELALKCYNEKIKIKNNKAIVYVFLKTTRNKNIFISRYLNKDTIFEKNKIINSSDIKIRIETVIIRSFGHNAKCEIYLNDIINILNGTIVCKKIKILDIIKVGDNCE